MLNDALSYAHRAWNVMKCRVCSDAATRFIFLLLGRLEQSIVIELQSNTYLFFPPSRVDVRRSREKLKDSNDRTACFRLATSYETV